MLKRNIFACPGVSVLGLLISAVAVGCGAEAEPGADAPSVDDTVVDTSEQGVSVPDPKTHSNHVPPGYACVWHDEFSNGLGPDFRPTNNNVNEERQHYLDELDTGDWNARVRDGKLQLRAKKEGSSGMTAAQMGRPVPADADNGANDATTAGSHPKLYSSAKYTTKGRHADKYGYIEAAVKLPRVRGSFPSLYMLNDAICEEPSTRADCRPWPSASEIDVFEYWNNVAEEHMQGNAFFDEGGQKNCTGDYWRCHQKQRSAFKMTPRSFDDWQIVGVEWTDDKIEWFLDGVSQGFLDTTGLSSYDESFFVMVNYAVGSTWQPEPYDISAEGSVVEYDYVRWYKRGAGEACGLGAGTIASSGKDLFNNPDFDGSIAGWSTYTQSARDTITSEPGGHARFNLFTNSGTEWHAQLYQSIQANGGTYKASFSAQKVSPGSREVYAFCEQDGGTYTNYGQVACAVGSGSWTTCSVTCTPPSGIQVKIGLKGGQNDQDFRVTSATLTQ